jgi:hypothetical protein
MRFLLPLTLPLVLGGAQDPAEWKPFVSKKGGFSVTLPAEPTEQVQTVKTPAGPVDVVLYLIDGKKDTVSYVVGYSQFPEKALQTGTSEKRLDNARDGAVQSAKGKLKEEKKVLLGSYPGRELLIESETGGFVRTRIYAVRNRLYQTMVIGNKESIESRAAGAFLDSFKLIGAGGA